MLNSSQPATATPTTPASAQFGLFGVNKSFIQSFIGRILSPNLWLSIELSDITALVDRATVLNFMEEQINGSLELLYNAAQKFEEKGYKPDELKLQIKFEIKGSGIVFNIELITNSTHTSTKRSTTYYNYSQKIPGYPGDLSWEVNDTVIKPEFIPSLIAAVRSGNSPPELSKDKVDMLRRQIEKYPNSEDGCINKICFERRDLTMFTITIDASLLLASTTSDDPNKCLYNKKSGDFGIFKNSVAMNRKGVDSSTIRQNESLS